MARGSDNQPAHMGPSGGKCQFVAYEQRKHRNVSRGNGAGYAKGRGGPSSWQSHHILCVSCLGDRKAKDEPTTQLLEQTLWETKWNVNEAPNMIGLPMYRRYVKEYQGLARDGLGAAVSPQNLPAHDVDHNTGGGYTEEVKDHLRDNVWRQFDGSEKDHERSVEWLHGMLLEASAHFQGVLLARGLREGGTVTAWRGRFENEEGWVEPFSMAEDPTPRSPGVNWTVLDSIFSALGL